MGKVGSKHSAETKAKIAAANRGRTRTEEARRKHSETRKRLFREGKIRIPWAGTTGIVTWNKKGSESSSWRGGRWKDKNGYIWVKSDHPQATKDGYILEHRLVMSTVLGRNLRSWEIVHHINAVKHDNRPENLMLLTKQTHRGKVICPHCQKEFVIR